MLPTVSST
jgi:hypothetical protein